MSAHNGCICRTIPEPVQRIVRQRCFFGCVICGLPMYHYDHIDDFAVYRDHAPDNIVLLCPNHHQDKTSGRITRDFVRRFANAPVNGSAHGTTAPYAIRLAGNTGRFVIGPNTYFYDFQADGEVFKAIILNDVPVFALTHHNGFLTLSLFMTDRAGEPILQIENGDMVVSVGVWDYTLEGRDITIRSALRNIELVVRILDDGLQVLRGRIVLGNRTLEITRDTQILWTNGNAEPVLTMEGIELVNYPAGLVVDSPNYTGPSLIVVS